MNNTIRHDLKDVISYSSDKKKLCGLKINVGKHGYVELIDWMGTDVSIVESARQSYNMGTDELTYDKTFGMIKNMTKNGHSSPFEQGIIKFKIKMPIFVARQFVRTRTASMNESSMRYTESSGDTWEPDNYTWDMRSDKGGIYDTSDEVCKRAQASITDMIKDDNEKAKEEYKDLLDKNLSKELARVVLPLSTYTEFVWSIDLNNIRHMLYLRMDSHAQREYFQFAVAIFALTSAVFPITMECFYNYSFLSANISYEDLIKSKSDMNIIRIKIDSIRKNNDAVKECMRNLLFDSIIESEEDKADDDDDESTDSYAKFNSKESFEESKKIRHEIFKNVFNKLYYPKNL